MKSLLKLSTTILILLFTLSINAQEEEVKTGCLSGDCENGKGKLVKKDVLDSATYEGEFKDGKYNGKGKITWSMSSLWVFDTYEGDFKNGRVTGFGTLTYKSGNVYIGHLNKLWKEGKGKMIYTDGRVEDGYWKNNNYIGKTKISDEEYDLRRKAKQDSIKNRFCVSGNCKNGFGKKSYRHGNITKSRIIYEGNFKDWKKHGKGTELKVDENKKEIEKYIGEWKNDKRDGSGELYKNGKLDYKGEFKKGNKYSKPESEEGCIEGDCKEGYGVYHYKYGNKYMGNWKSGKQNGQGTWVNFDKSKLVGNWKDNFQVGVFEIFNPDGILSHREIWGSKGLLKPGCVSGDCENGWGKYVWQDGNWYEGNWGNGQQHGTGNLYWFNGNKYFGDWKNNLMDGIGTLIWKDRTIYKGEFKNGSMNGKGKEYSKDSVLIRTGTWIDGVYQVGNTGCISGNCENGTGTFLFEIGHKYIGEWKNSKFHGTGTYYLENGEIYHKGQWKDHQKID